MVNSIPLCVGVAFAFFGLLGATYGRVSGLVHLFSLCSFFISFIHLIYFILFFYSFIQGGKAKTFLRFLDASLHLYMRVCPSIRRSVRRSIRRSVCHAFVKNKENQRFRAITVMRTHCWPYGPCYLLLRFRLLL